MARGRRADIEDLERPRQTSAALRTPSLRARPAGVGRGRAPPGRHLGPADRDLPPQPGRPGRAALRAGIAPGAPAGRGPAVVHDDVRPRQHPHQPAGAAVRARAGGDDAARAGRAAGAHGRLPRRGAGQDPARDALRRDDRVRGAAALALLRRGRRDPAVRRPARRVRALDRRHARSCASSSARRARRSHWIDEYADLRRATATSEYQRRNEETGLENQCWKDSWDSISFARRHARADFPRATCELQGYAYDAKVRGARLARERLERPRATPTSWSARRPTSSGASTATSGSPTASYFALALDARRRQVDALTSNIGHLLWSGIVDEDKAEPVRAAPDRADGCSRAGACARWPTGEGRYNPIGYHVGTVWPFDNSFIAWGLRRYGFKDEAARDRRGDPRGGGVLRRPAARGVRRLPARRRPATRSQYPTACSPQAWSTGAPLLLLRTLLGLDPDGEHLIVDPALPAAASAGIELLDIPGGWGRIDAFGRALAAHED